MSHGLQDLRIKIFADGADLAGIVSLARNPLVKGFTTNPTLMRAAGVSAYEVFAREILEVVSDRPVSFEVLSDDFDDMERQALKVASWGDNVFVKIPVMNTRAEISAPLIRRLTDQGVQVNVTAVMTVRQVEEVAACMVAAAGFISVFAGRVADTGRDPVPIMAECVDILASYPQVELIWASPREILNVFQADAAGCDVITVTHDLLKKLTLVGKDLDEFSLDTVKMFFNDARAAGYTL
jgi:transaldolase